MNVTCPQCNIVYDQSRKFCGKCGIPLIPIATHPDALGVLPAGVDVSSHQYSASPSTPKNNTPIFIGIAIIMAACIGYFAYTQFAVKKDVSVSSKTSAINNNIDISQYIHSASASSSTRDNSANIVYSPDKLYDNSEITCWAADLRSDPNPSVLFTFSQPMVITGISAIPGYKKFYKIDRYIQNFKPRQVTLTYDNQGRKDNITFDLADNYASLGWQTRSLESPVTTKSVTVKIVDTYPGKYQGNKAPSTDLSISEFHFIGYPEK